MASSRRSCSAPVGSGELEPVLVHLKRGHELGRRRRLWNLPSADWVARCELKLAAARANRGGGRD